MAAEPNLESINAELMGYANSLAFVVSKCKEAVCDAVGGTVKTENYRLSMKKFLKGRTEEWAEDLRLIFGTQEEFVKHLTGIHNTSGAPGTAMTGNAYL